MLVPDANSGRKVRCLLAQEKLGLGVKVVTWPELLEELRLETLMPAPAEDWVTSVKEEISSINDAFWSKSYLVDPIGTANEISNSLHELLLRGDLNTPVSDQGLSERSLSTLNDFRRLWDAVGKTYPAEIELIQSFVKAGQDSLGKIGVYWVRGWPSLSPLQETLVQYFAPDEHSRNTQLVATLTEVAGLPEVTGQSATSLKLAHSCFEGAKGSLQIDDSVNFFVARDALEEAECATSSVQQLLSSGCSPSDIGILIPRDAQYKTAIETCLFLAGQVTAGLQHTYVNRDLGGEVVRSLILLARGAIPKMALASLLASPLAPWSQQTGNQLALRVNSGRFDLKPIYGMEESEEKNLVTLRLLRDGKASLTDAIEVFAKGTDDPLHQARLRALTSVIAQRISGSGDPDYDSLLDIVGHEKTPIDHVVQYPQNGIRVFYEHQETWATVDHLFVLGFNSGNYPTSPATSPVFHETEKRDLNSVLGWNMLTAEDKLQVNRARFQRQIGSASKSLTFYTSARNYGGSSRSPSETATFIAGVLGSDVDDLFKSVSTAGASLPSVPATSPTPPREIEIADLDLKTDLLTVRSKSDGSPIPESPSSLETLLVSPLGWFLRKFGTAPSPWEPDTLDARLQGNIAHSVFETLFPVEGEPFDISKVEEIVDAALLDAIRKEAPLMTNAQWKVERNVLRSTLVQAVLHWRSVLEHLNARVVGAEKSLSGEFNGMPTKGYSDEVIQLPEGTLLVVDFKKSGSSKRRDRMELGYDCQVSLYEQMISAGIGDVSLDARSKKSGLVYFTLNDQRVVSDQKSGLSNQTPGLLVVSGDVSANALREITENMNKLRKGVIELNHEGDDTRLEKQKALPSFALDISPLIRMFSHPEDRGDAQ